MKKFFTLLFLFTLTTGCNFLSSNQEDSLAEDGLTEEESLDDIIVEEDLDENLEEEFDEDMDEDLEEEEFEEEMDEDEEEEFDEDGKRKKKGFFSWLFGGSDEDDESDEELDSDFIGEDEDFSSIDRDYEDYEEEGEEENLTESSTSQNITEQEPTLTETTQEESPNIEETQPVTKQAVSLNKIMTVPYTKAGQIVNAVYIARQNEDLALISEKIYGRNETDQLLKINTHLQNRSVVTGDKIYYNSPNRPNDSTRLLFYYQDNNISPSYYNLAPGDNIRTIAFQLLGHPKSWKEIWATNPNLKSKSTVETGLNIVYWQATTQTAPPKPAPVAQAEQIPQAEPLNEIAQEVIPAPEEKLNDEMPQIEEELKQPAPTIPTDIQEKQSKGILKELLNNIEMIAVIIIFLILLYLIIRIILKKKNQRDFDYTATNIEVE